LRGNLSLINCNNLGSVTTPWRNIRNQAEMLSSRKFGRKELSVKSFDRTQNSWNVSDVKLDSQSVFPPLFPTFNKEIIRILVTAVLIVKQFTDTVNHLPFFLFINLELLLWIQIWEKLTIVSLQERPWEFLLTFESFIMKSMNWC